MIEFNCIRDLTTGNIVRRVIISDCKNGMCTLFVLSLGQFNINSFEEE